MPYFYKIQNQEFGPFEERTIIARMIDGEINSKTPVRESGSDEYKQLIDTDFGSVLSRMTSRWKYNIGALAREHFYLLVSIAVWLLPLLIYLGGVFNPVCRKILMHYGSLWVFGLISIIGFIGGCYFTWMFAYRCWRVVPKSQYSITPGWRIMLTFIPVFRLGWNYCMWVPLANRLRKLSEYSVRAGKAAAIMYSSGVIVLTLSIYAVLLLPWCYPVLNLTFMDYPLWQNIIGFSLILLLFVSFFFTVASFIVMTFKLKRAALLVLRRRYAYNLTSRTFDTKFMLKILSRQRHADRVRRWGHGVGIAGVLIGWPVVLVLLPTLILFIIGSCNYSGTKQQLSEAGYPAGLKELNNRPQLQDNGFYDLSDFALDKDSKEAALEAQVDKILNHESIDLGIDFEHPEKSGKGVEKLFLLANYVLNRTENDIENSRYLALDRDFLQLIKIRNWFLSTPYPPSFILGLALEGQIIELQQSLIQDVTLAKLETPFLEMLYKDDDFVEAQIRYSARQTLAAKFFIDEATRKNIKFVFPPENNNILDVRTAGYIYAKTPFFYFTLERDLRKTLKFAAELGKDYFQMNRRVINDYCNSDITGLDSDKAQVGMALKNIAANEILALRKVKIILAAELAKRAKVTTETYLKNIPLNPLTGIKLALPIEK